MHTCLLAKKLEWEKATTARWGAGRSIERERPYSATEATMSLHAPSLGWFIASLIIAMFAVVGALSPVPYITTYGIWVAILAYVVLAIGNLTQT